MTSSSLDELSTVQEPESDSGVRKRVASRNLLIVEDDPDTQEVLGMTLARLGYRVHAADNGRDALRLLRSGERFCAILLDMMLPGMDGWQFRVEQQSDPELAAIPVIVMTGSASADGMPADIALVQKPLTVDAIIAELQKACEPTETTS